MRSGAGCCCRGPFLEAAFELALEERFREDVDFLAVPGDAFWVAGLAVDLPEEATPFDLLSAVFFLAVAGSGAPWKAAGRSGCQAKRNASSGIRTSLLPGGAAARLPVYQMVALETLPGVCGWMNKPALLTAAAR